MQNVQIVLETSSCWDKIGIFAQTKTILYPNSSAPWAAIALPLSQTLTWCNFRNGNKREHMRDYIKKYIVDCSQYLNFVMLFSSRVARVCFHPESPEYWLDWLTDWRQIFVKVDLYSCIIAKPFILKNISCLYCCNAVMDNFAKHQQSVHLYKSSCWNDKQRCE